MQQKKWLLWIPLALLGIVILISHPAVANAQPAAAQHQVMAPQEVAPLVVAPQVVYQTPTARPDGRVIYVVQPNDTCLRIQLLTGVTIEQLRLLNKLDQNCTIAEGKELLLMVVTPVASPTPNPKISPTPLLPTPTLPKGNGKICFLLYDDINGDAIHGDSEPSLAGGAVSITDRLGKISKTVNTSDSSDPLCEEVPEGDYSVSMAIPGGYNPTVNMNSQVKVLAGDQAILEYGAQISSKIEETATPQNPQSDNSLILAIMGGLLVVVGIGLGAYIVFTRRS